MTVAESKHVVLDAETDVPVLLVLLVAPVVVVATALTVVLLLVALVIEREKEEETNVKPDCTEDLYDVCGKSKRLNIDEVDEDVDFAKVSPLF